MKRISGVACILFLIVTSCWSQDTATFTNPLLPSGADPWSIYKDAYYYYTPTTGDRQPIEWFHDIFFPNGTPYRQDKVNLIRKLNGK